MSGLRQALATGALLAAVLACGGASLPSAGEPAPAPPPAPAAQPSNVLVVILDDVGVEKVAAYGEDPRAPATPTLSRLAAEGVRFRNAWATPVCSPTRAAIQTGRYPRRTGIGKIIDSWSDEWDLALDEVTLPEMLDRAPVAWDTAYVGKWHLASRRSGDPLTHPLRQGYDFWTGTVGNLRDVPLTGERQRALGYFRWEQVVNGAVRESTRYVTSETADQAIARIGALREPWLLVVGFNAAHVPLHVPPAELRTIEVTASSPEQDRYDAALEAVDHELGRVIAALDPALRARTTVIVIADNGTTPEGVRPPADPELAKGSLMEAGINVPLIVTGPDVRQPGSESAALVHAADLFATVADLAGVDVRTLPNPIDGVSFRPSLRDPGAPGARTYVHSEKFAPNGRGPYERDAVTVRDARWKLVRDLGPNPVGDRLYDLEGRHDDGPNLLKRPRIDPEVAAAHDRLRAELARLQAEVERGGATERPPSVTP